MKIQTKKQLKSKIKSICLAYDEDLEQVYSFYCARYENIRFKDFLDLGINELRKKLGSIPESEPLHTIIKSRIINPSKIKDKEEKKHWQELKKIHEIPSIFLPREEIKNEVNRKLEENKYVK